ncbi:RNA-directed DNA polymerase [Halobacillus litoralis]|uniref:RNA-directed DNA polymerase n=1 Tax=Halobacillus litoralis TaxID=45668 RepID=UPI001CD4ED7E|nr:RNA-directed DNA polymerase [Halobacillus litoralis]MCA1022688.1 RNA-directed DNA polymerase [Halobacillus litoralis]
MARYYNTSLEEQLIKYGYFSEHIPPCFNTDSFYKQYDILKNAAQKIHSEPMTLTVAKNDDNFRRTIKIPNPEQQIKLFAFILDKKNEIDEILSRNGHTLANPIRFTTINYDDIHFFDIPVLKDRHKIKSNFLENLSKKMKRSMGYKYVYKLDLANFYDSIYTHTIEWAVIGKKEAKENNLRKNHKGNLGEKLDELVGRTNNKETSGIPTGPFTSRIISEVLLSKVDEEMEGIKKSEGIDFDFLHFVDDYEFYFRSEADYKNTKNQIRHVFDKYRLKINENKTHFTSYPYHHNTDLRDEFDYYIDKYKEKTNSQNARMIFFKGDELNNCGEKGAYKYLYKQLEKINFTEVWKDIEPFLIGHILVKPALAQYVIKIIDRHKEFVTEDLKKELIVNLDISIQDSLDNEAEWLFWILSVLEVDVSKSDIAKWLIKTEDDLLKIMLINYAHKQGIEKTTEVQQCLRDILHFLNDESMRGERWLLIYEWVINKWDGYKELNDKFEDMGFFKALQKRKVIFFNPTG